LALFIVEVLAGVSDFFPNAERLFLRAEHHLVFQVFEMLPAGIGCDGPISEVPASFAHTISDAVLWPNNTFSMLSWHSNKHNTLVGVCRNCRTMQSGGEFPEHSSPKVPKVNPTWHLGNFEITNPLELPV
jgi:hypothetical protein